MDKIMMLLPIMTFLVYISILLNIPIFRDIIVFTYLSFIPGFVLLGLLKLNRISLLDTFLFSVGLSIAFLMFMGLAINELFPFLVFSQPLSSVPLTMVIPAFTLLIFFVECRHGLVIALKFGGFGGKLKSILPVSSLLVLLPLLSIFGALFVNIPLMLLSYAIIAVLCIMSTLSKKRVPSFLYPFLIFSISIALIGQTLLMSKYTIGFDAQLEYYVFKLTQINGHWSFLRPYANSAAAMVYDSLLSVTILPVIYSALMGSQGEMVFKTLYPFIFSLVPLILFRIYEKQTGKLIGLLSTFFFVFTFTAFFGVEPLGLNRQIVGEFFLILSIFLIIDKTISTAKRRLLLTVFGAALVVSHYSLAYLYLAFVTAIFIISRIKPKFDNTFNGVVVLLLFGITFSWYTIGSNTIITSLANTIKLAFVELTAGGLAGQAGSSASMVNVPQVFTVSSWINLALIGIANIFLVIGVFAVILRRKRTEISELYIALLVMSGVILCVAYVAPSIASSFNFTRFYAVTLLFLSPCFVIGGKFLLVKGQKNFKGTQVNEVLLIITILLSAYFLSQSGFINHMTGGAVHSYSLDFDRMKISSDPQVATYFYDAYNPEQDVYSSVWLSQLKGESSKVYADYESGTHVLISYALLPEQLILPLTNEAAPEQGTFIFLDRLNIVNGIIPTSTGSFNSSEISIFFYEGDLVYSNGNNEILFATPHG